jgi:hypothetical protein
MPRQWVDEVGGLTGEVFIPLGPPGSFDSHIVFAGAFPTPVDDGHGGAVRIYYMGGNGPVGGLLYHHYEY